MTYIVAFVRFPGGKSDYNFNCLRTDIHADDKVLVRLRDGRLRPGTVTRIAYLDWDCGGRIECKRSESIQTPQGMMPPEGAPRVVGLVNIWTMTQHLAAIGWRALRPDTHVHRAVFTFVNKRDRANIWLRRRGVDLQILEGVTELPPLHDFPRVGINDGRTVRHALAQTTFNLYEGVARFAQAFAEDTRDYDRFFKKVGSVIRKTPDQMQRFPRPEQDFESMLYEALGGDGGLAYVGDGLYLGSDGSWHDG